MISRFLFVFLKRTFAVGNLRRNDGGSLLLLGDNFGDDLGAGDFGIVKRTLCVRVCVCIARLSML